MIEHQLSISFSQHVHLESSKVTMTQIWQNLCDICTPDLDHNCTAEPMHASMHFLSLGLASGVYGGVWCSASPQREQQEGMTHVES